MEGTVTNAAPKRIAVVTGANKGIGFEICRQLAINEVLVVLTARDEKRGTQAVENLKVNNAGITGVIVDAKSFASLNLKDGEVIGAKAHLAKKVMKQTYETAEGCLGTNYYGPKQLTQALIPLLQLSESARIVNVSSTLGQLKNISKESAKRVLSNVDDLTEEKIDEIVNQFLKDAKEDLLECKGWPINLSAYIVSKAALNAYSRILARKLPEFGVNSVSPGFVKTEMNCNNGEFSIDEGAEGPVALPLTPVGGHSGLFFDRMEISTF